jgi:sporulation protein YlmC with PRC-barrel domain
MDGQDQLIGTPVVDNAGQTVGVVSALLVDPESLQGRWLRIQLADDPSRRHAVVPLAAASVDPAGQMVLPWTADTVAHAPQVGNQISNGQARALTSYYGLDL